MYVQPHFLARACWPHVYVHQVQSWSNVPLWHPSLMDADLSARSPVLLVYPLSFPIHSMYVSGTLSVTPTVTPPQPRDPHSPFLSPAFVCTASTQVRVANLQADQWKKEAETLRARLASLNSGGGGGGGTTRSPLRQSTGSTGQGRPSIENRGQVRFFFFFAHHIHLQSFEGRLATAGIFCLNI